MTRETAVNAALILLPFALTALAALAAWVVSLVARHIKNKERAAALSLLAYGAANVAADFAQHVVSDLKDPSKPGTWTAVVGASLRIQAVGKLRTLYPFAVDVLTRALKDPTKVDEVLGGALEKAVVDMKTKGPTVSAATGSGDVTVNVEAEIPAPVDSNTQLGAVDVRTLVAVALALVVAAVGCPASRQLTRPALGAVDGCEPRATRCSPDGRPQVCSGSRRWTDADGVCTHGVNVAAVCCLTTSPVTGNALHACVLAERCTADAGAP